MYIPVITKIEPILVPSARFRYLASILRRIAQWQDPVTFSNPAIVSDGLDIPMSNQVAPALVPVAPDHEIIIVPAGGHPDRQPLLDQCLGIRVEVFVHEQGFSLEDEFDKYVYPNYVASFVPQQPHCSVTHLVPCVVSARAS
ncbi:hypothetical protein M404DRAFT_683555 [Pisolithus tinctorius Marx 270]|uniref:Uncharacterized protein n=1 Tax=Pisolithus tinctorius Marx 270 TaxID=870435 RepID=A0A0C3JTT2_PISTI|nr:hypothetical protein M404DRAFT_683555 [Pisolithus tinctorius Marx 270]